MAQNSKLTIVFIGSSQKEALLQKMKSRAVKCEKHIIYDDTCYLTYVVDGLEVVVELIDPGMERTGARQMSVRKANGVMLSYHTLSKSAINQLCDIASDFQIIENKVKPPIFLITNEDVVERCSQPTSAPISQKYKSNSVHPLIIESASKIKNDMNLDCSCCGNDTITKLQGQNIADLFGAYCKSIRMPSYDGTLKFMEEIIRTIRLQHEERRNSSLRWFRKLKNEKTAGKAKTKVDSKICSII